MTDIPLTAAQRSLWAAQLAIGDIPIAVAQCVRITGPLDVPRMLESMRRSYRELGVATGPIVVAPEGPRILGIDSDFAVEHVDLRQHADPDAAADEWMAAACGRRMQIDSDELLITALLRTDEDRWRLFTRAHHILLDGYGGLAVMRRGAALYRFRRDRPSAIPALPPPAALSDADQAYRASPRYLRDRDYWRELLRDLPEPIALGDLRAPPSAQPIRLSGTTDEVFTAAIRACSTALSTHSSAVLVAAIGAFVARLADRDQVVVSLPVPARSSANAKSAAGSASNLVPLVISAPAGVSLRDFVGSVGTSISGALRHQCYRHEEMLHDINAPLTSLHQFGPVINMFPVPPKIDLGPVSAEYEVLSTGPVLDLNINVYPATHNQTQRIDLEANPRSYSAATVSALHQQLMAFLTRFTRLGPDEPIERLPLGPPQSDRVDPTTEPPPPTTMAALFAEAPADDTVAVIDGATAVTYRQLRTRATWLTESLRAAGAGPETSVAALLPRSADSVVAAWAIAQTGACYVPIDPRYPTARITTILSAAECRIGVSDSPPASTRNAIRWLSPDRSPPLGTPGTPAPTPHTDHPAYQIYTSGSTGSPKGVVVTGRGLAALATEIRASYALESSSVLAHFASPSFDTSIVEMLAAAVSGAALAIVPPDVVGGSELADVLETRAVTDLLITPSALATLPPDRLPELRSVLAGGEACPPALARRWITSGRRFRCAYGPTETTCSVTITAALTDADVRHRVPIGGNMPAVQSLVLDHRLRPQPVGAIGELFIAGPSLARGYRSASMTAQRFLPNPWGAPGSRMYRTGDLVCRRPDGGLDFRGRTDDQLKLRGFRVEPGEIDTVVRGLAGVENAVTIARPRGDSASLATYVTGHDLHPGRLRAELARMLPGFLMPSTITVLDEFPTTATGKLDRTRLPAPDTEATTAYRPATTSLEKHCQQLFSEITGAHGIGVDHDFFAIGGDSLSATELVARINAAAAASLTVRDVIEARTPAALAAVVTAAELPPITYAAPQPTAVSPAQRNVDLSECGPANVIPFAVRVPAVDLDALDAAIADVTSVHQLLRATFADGLIHPDTARPIRLEPFDGDIEAFVHAGFDLSRDPPIRVGYRADQEGMQFAVALHHVAIDGRSISILAADLASAYLARAGGHTPRLPTPEVDYLDYSRWIAEWLGDPADPRSRYAAQVGYWRGELSGLPDAFGTPSTRQRPVPWDRCGRRRTYELDGPVWAAWQSIGRRCGTTAFAAARGSIAQYLCAVTGAPDIVIGTPVAGRLRSECDQMVGMFVNTLPLRYRIMPAESLDSVVAEHIDTERRAHRHSDVAYRDIAQALGHTRPDVHPLFQIVVSIDDVPTLPVSIGQELASITPLPAPVAKCDLHFSIRPPHDDAPAAVEVLYPTAMFDAADVDRLVEGWQRSVRPTEMS